MRRVPGWSTPSATTYVARAGRRRWRIGQLFRWRGSRRPGLFGAAARNHVFEPDGSLIEAARPMGGADGRRAPRRVALPGRGASPVAQQACRGLADSSSAMASNCVPDLVRHPPRGRARRARPGAPRDRRSSATRQAAAASAISSRRGGCRCRGRQRPPAPRCALPTASAAVGDPVDHGDGVGRRGHHAGGDGAARSADGGSGTTRSAIWARWPMPGRSRATAADRRRLRNRLRVVDAQGRYALADGALVASGRPDSVPASEYPVARQAAPLLDGSSIPPPTSVAARAAPAGGSLGLAVARCSGSEAPP